VRSLPHAYGAREPPIQKAQDATQDMNGPKRTVHRRAAQRLDSLLDALDGQREDGLHRGSAAINVQQLAGDEVRLVSA